MIDKYLTHNRRVSLQGWRFARWAMSGNLPAIQWRSWWSWSWTRWFHLAAGMAVHNRIISMSDGSGLIHFEWDVKRERGNGSKEKKRYLILSLRRYLVTRLHAWQRLQADTFRIRKESNLPLQLNIMLLPPQLWMLANSWRLITGSRSDLR